MKVYRNESWLKQKYLIEKLSSTQIAKLVGTGHSVILCWLRRFKIPVRTLLESHPQKVRLSKEFLQKEYWEKDKSFEMIGREHGLSYTTIQYWFNRYKLPRKLNTDRSHMIGSRNKKWKGGTYITPDGYRYILSPGHPRKSGGTKLRPYVPEQVLVMEKELGRFLLPIEVVHHKNGIKLNNDISNLQLMKNETEHQTYEQTLNLFCKQLLFGSIIPSNREELLRLLDQFVNERG